MRVARAQVIDSAWRQLGPGLEPLSTPDGGPLSRTVKLMVMPLVLRPSARRDLASPALDPVLAAEVEQLITADRDRLVAAAAWFRLAAAAPEVVRVGRDRCYPLAYALATTHGAPGADAGTVLASAWPELLATHAGLGPTAVRAVADDPRTARDLTDRLARGWAACPPPEGIDEAAAEHVRRVLDGFAPGGGRSEEQAGEQADDAWQDLVHSEAGSRSGIAVRHDDWPTALPAPGRARGLGLTARDRVPRPELHGEGDRPWDRGVIDRVVTVLQHTPDRGGLPSAAALVTQEVDRVCGPWEVASEPSRAAMLLGSTLALAVRDDLRPATAAQRIVAGMRRRESWLSRARRVPISVDEDPADPVGPYLRRLWTRLHGAETRAVPLDDVDQAARILTGVARSVLLDGRSRVRAELIRGGGE